MVGSENLSSAHPVPRGMGRLGIDTAVNMIRCSLHWIPADQLDRDVNTKKLSSMRLPFLPSRHKENSVKSSALLIQSQKCGKLFPKSSFQKRQKSAFCILSGFFCIQEIWWPECETWKFGLYWENSQKIQESWHKCLDQISLTSLMTFLSLYMKLLLPLKWLTCSTPVM